MQKYSRQYKVKKKKKKDILAKSLRRRPVGSRGGARTDGLLISAEGPEEPGRPREELGTQCPGARLLGTE